MIFRFKFVVFGTLDFVLHSFWVWVFGGCREFEVFKLGLLVGVGTLPLICLGPESWIFVYG